MGTFIVITIIVALLVALLFLHEGNLYGPKVSWFAELIGSNHKKEELAYNRNMIYQRFEANYSHKKALLSDDIHQRAAPVRYLSTQAIRSVCMLTDGEILEAVRSAPDLRLRPIKSNEDLKVSDMTVVEHYLVTDCDSTYGYCRWDNDKALVLLNPAGAIEPGMSHIIATLAQNMDCNIITRERRFYGNANEDGITVSPFYVDMQASDGNAVFTKYLSALQQIHRGQRVICLMSGASGGADFEMEWGVPKNTNGYQFDGSHVAEEDHKWVQHLGEILQAHATNITVHSASRKDFTFNFTFKTSSKGYGRTERHIARAINNHTGATVVMLYLNVQTILNADDERYYAAIKVLLDALEELEGTY